MRLSDLYKKLRETLSESDARYAIQKRSGLDDASIIASPDQEIDATQILKDLGRYQAGEPLSRIYGTREFWGLEFELNEATLDPRPDTETLIEAVLSRYKDNPPKTILDMGTGTGCILIALLSEFTIARGVGVDVSEKALEAAQNNAKHNGVGDRVTFIQSNWDENIDESFDLVVSNPPYIAESVIPNLDESVKKHDPILALDGGKDGLQAYKIIFSRLSGLLNEEGRAFFEIGYDQEKSTTRLGTESRLSLESTYADLAGHIRVVELVPEKTSGDK